MSTLNMKCGYLETFLVSSMKDSWSKTSEHLFYKQMAVYGLCRGYFMSADGIWMSDLHPCVLDEILGLINIFYPKVSKYSKHKNL